MPRRCNEPHPLYLWTRVCGDTVSGAGCFGGKLLLLLLAKQDGFAVDTFDGVEDDE